MNLIVGPGLVGMSREMWRVYAAAGLRVFTLPVRITLVQPTEEDLERARVLWPMADRRRRDAWGELKPTDVVLCDSRAEPPIHKGGRMSVHVDAPEDPWS